MFDRSLCQLGCDNWKSGLFGALNGSGIFSSMKTINSDDSDEMTVFRTEEVETSNQKRNLPRSCG